MTDADLLSPQYLGGPTVDTTNCEREPIHIPGSVQPHGVLLVLSHDLTILQASANARTLLGLDPDELLGQPLGHVAEQREVQALRRFLDSGGYAGGQFTSTLRFGPRRELDATVQRSGDRLLLELEPRDPDTSSEFYHVIKNALSALETAPDLASLTQRAAEQVRALTGFDRVMIYRFAPDDSGLVIAEAKQPELHPFLGHRFPESDIPRQARALYVQHLIRLTADVNAAPAPLVPVLDPESGQPVNLGGAVLRSTSPVHLQYLRNMGVGSSLSVSIVQDGRLWGLISCHHTTGRVISQPTRSALEFLARVLNLQVKAKLEQEIAQFRQQRQEVQRRIADRLSSSLTPLQTLAEPDLGLMTLLDCGGLAMHFDGQLQLMGQTPAPEQVMALIQWLREQPNDLYATDALSSEWPPAEADERVASGLLAISVSGGWQEALLWFRPELPQTVAWGGDPTKPVERAADGSAQLTPRHSFDTYIQQVRGRSEPWHQGEIAEAQDLRRALTSAVGERLTMLRSLNDQLGRANDRLNRANTEWREYAFVMSHDLQEPLRLISNFLELFGVRFGGQLDASAEKMIEFTLGEAERLRSLIRDLYSYTELSAGAPPRRAEVDLNAVLQQLQRELAAAIASSGARITVDPLPQVQGNAARLQQALCHLLDNAIKFSRPDTPLVHVSAKRVTEGWAIRVHDQGPGIAPEYHDKIFTVFQRLGKREDSVGNGIGLAIARKIAELHGGSLSVSSGVGHGSTFTLTLPDDQPSPGPHV
ncbi:ATP-binding protein [Deinococcus sonorensis]|uniref:histidine kinase n=2 Tax=Deinococcus sonorensis TaxID=309891 RepID=A0AAU7UGG9_9DEIO